MTIENQFHWLECYVMFNILQFFNLEKALKITSKIKFSCADKDFVKKLNQLKSVYVLEAH